MTERATIFQTAQIGVQSSAGTGVAANKLLQALEISPAIEVETGAFRAMGYKFPTIVTPMDEMVKAGLKGVVTYNELVYPLSSLANYAAPVQQGATAAYKWTFAPSSTAGDTAKLFTVEQGGSVRAHKFIDGLVTGLTLKFSRKGCELDGEMIGAALQDGISMTGSPTAIALVPTLPKHVDVYLADTAAGLSGASKLTRALEVSWSLTDKYGPVFTLNSTNGTGFATTVETEPKLECKLKMEADSEGMALLTNLRAGSSKYMRIKAVGDLIASTYYYTIQIDTALKVESVSEFSDEDGIYAVEWTLAGVHDATWGLATQIDVTNVLTAL